MGFNGYWSPTSKIKNWLIKNKGPNIAFISESDLWESLASIEAKDEQYMCDLMQINLKDWEPSTVDWMYPQNSILQPMFDRYKLKIIEYIQFVWSFDKTRLHTERIRKYVP